jgi:hypothetical protein
MLFFSLATCANSAYYDSSQASWRGKSVNLLISQKGQPDTIMPLSQGGKAYIYIDQESANVPSYASPNPTVFVGPKGQTFSANVPSGDAMRGYKITKCTTIFYVNARGVIMHVEQKGARCD